MAEVTHPGSVLTAQAVIEYTTPVFHPRSTLSAMATIEHTSTKPRLKLTCGATIEITSGASVSMTIEPVDPPEGMEVVARIITPDPPDLEFDRYGRPL